ncbi:MAG: SRPBCC family protein [Vicinamibacteria bacterium]|nr:SRPBCC family protein [Vicinamibacteria bacterium]
MRFTCRPVGLDFIEEAAYRFENVVELEAPPEAVFDIFADGESWPRWFDGIQRVVWTSPEPKGVGTTRTVTLTTMTVYEHFLAWEHGRRFAFRFVGSSLPLCRAGIEDYQLEALPGGRTRFFYGVYLEPSLVVRLAGPIARAQFRGMFSRAAQGLKAYIAARPR